MRKKKQKSVTGQWDWPPTIIVSLLLVIVLRGHEMRLIPILIFISFLIRMIFLILSINESFKVFMYFKKELKKRKVYKHEYYLKAKKLLFYCLAFVIASVIYSVVKTL